METLKRLKNPKIQILLGLGFCVLVALLLHLFQVGAQLSRTVLDKQFIRMQQNSVHRLQNDVVIVGIDEDATKALKEPFALWHPHLGKFLDAMAIAKPSVLGLDIALPERSYQFLIPQYDQSLVQGLQKLKSQTPLVLAQMLDESGAFRPVHPPYVSAAGADALASVVVCPDDDGVVRRFDPNLCTVNAQGSMLVEKMAAHLGKTNPGTGLIDFSAGDKFDYVPFLKVLEWQARGDAVQLAGTFGGKPVLLGVVSRFGDRARAPVPLAAWDPFKLRVPGVLMQAQILRSMLSDGLIRQANSFVVGALTLLAAFFWLGRIGWIKLAALVAFPVLLWLFSTWQLERGMYWPIGGIVLSGVFAFVLRLFHEGVQQVTKRHWLRDIFGSYVSQEVLQEIMAGNIHSGLEGQRVRLCILYADIHSFSERCEKRPPQEVVALLNDYFAEMTVAIHQHRGTLDKFIGDGIMAFFGAPQALECPEKNALEAAQEMLLRLRLVNARLQEQGIAPVEIGIALHVGELVTGYIGSKSRHEYTVIGDVVNLTAKLEELTKTLGYPVVCSAAVAKAVEQSGGLVDCGEHEVKDVALRVYGWNPPRLAVN
ncbi:MAG: adenylate/guanylate cyclase domain-containing protein [Gammaproteobacteria bacterium]|nr:adenylate/guanylate cyclase domain-containing protein [Gammaproteobacteria bacterium]MBU1480534.1 adenylate/guanylate cyclase domain-containing protein [Gammaproteobacteria bacterium]